MTSRRELRAIRRRAAILGTLAELGRVHPDGIGRALGRQPVRVINDLLWLEGAGRVVRDRDADLASAFWRLPTPPLDDDWIDETLSDIFGPDPRDGGNRAERHGDGPERQFDSPT